MSSLDASTRNEPSVSFLQGFLLFVLYYSKLFYVSIVCTMKHNVTGSVKDPVHPSVVLERNRGSLTRFECLEISQYEEIYFLGKHHAKFHELHDASVTPHSASNPCFTDNKNGHYCVLPGDHIQYRYEVLRFIASGSFGSVYKCKDHKTGEFVAVKISTRRNAPAHEAQHEVTMMQHLKMSGQHPGVIAMYDSFKFRKHVVIVYELLGMDLYEHMKILQFKGCRESFVKCIAVQAFDVLGYLHDKSITHCDVKPENILLCGLGSSSIKLIDFGSSCFQDKPVFTYVQSRYYRAPEVLLGLPYGTEIDIWSLGCVLYELLMGKPLFCAKTEGQMVSAMASLLGPVPLYMANASTRRSMFFEPNSNTLLEAKTWDRSRSGSRDPLLEVSRSIKGGTLFSDLLAKCLRWDPKDRINAQEALAHPWFGSSFSTRYLRPSSHHINPCRDNSCSC